MSTPAQAIETDPKVLMRSIIQRIATGPDLSKDISFEEARAGMRLVLEGQVEPVQAAIFFIALRMKRETREENLGVFDAMIAATDIATAEVDDLVDVADPYDGHNRTLPSSPFLPALLAACGVPAVCHGLETVGPKYGITHRQVLRAAGVDVDLGSSAAAARVADVGWAYVDQKQFCKPVHDLVWLRTQMVKRPVITTVEVLTGPVRARGRTHLMTGYVHKPYPAIYAMLARHAGFDSAILVRGVEGGVIPSLRQPGKLFYYHDKGEEQSLDLDPAALGIKQDVRAVAFPDDLPKAADRRDEIGLEVDSEAVAQVAADHGQQALAGQPGATRDGLVYAAAIVLAHLGRSDSLPEAADMARKALDSGAALACFKA